MNRFAREWPELLCHAFGALAWMFGVPVTLPPPYPDVDVPEQRRETRIADGVRK